MGNIPLVDLQWQHRQIEDDLRPALDSVMQRGAFILGAEVEELERAFAAFCGAEHCVGVASGTDALECALRAIDVGAGDEVILPANTFIATALAVQRIGATPVLVDCDERDALIDPGQIAAKITPRSKAIVPVHLYGQIAPMAPVLDTAAQHRLAVIEDAAQAHGATQDGKGIGSFGVAAGVSFYPGKNLGAYGDGGAVLTNSAELAERLRALRNWGSLVKYSHPEVGFNSRLDTMQAAVLLQKLARLAEWNEQRREAAAYYEELLGSSAKIGLPRVAPGNQHVWHLYVVRVGNRDRVLAALNDAGIGAGIHYPTPLHRQGALASLGHRQGDFPNAERLAGEILSLPIYPGITRQQQQRVVEVLTAAVE